MEPEVREFLKRISLSLGVGILWMALNSTFGIMYDYAFIHDSVTIGNIIFYIWFPVSIFLLIWFYIRLWKKPIE